MNLPSRVFYGAAILLLSLLPLCSNPDSGLAQSTHGGKIQTSYDGFSHETIISLQKMRVSCEGAKSTFKNACVSMAVSLHCRGVQAYQVDYVTLEFMFETREWDQRHAMDQRSLSVVVNNDTLRIGQMKLMSQSVDDSMTETLGITFPYDSF